MLSFASRRRFAAFFAAAFAALPASVGAQNVPPPAHAKLPANKDLPNFAQVGPGIYRGAAPTAEGLKKLRAMGVRTVIDLRIEDRKLQAVEAAQAQSLGMTRVHIPLGREAPTKKQVATFLSTLESAPAKPVFVHCHYGADRTGAMVGIYRVTHDKWSWEKTWQEMRRYGFKKYLHELKGAVASRAAPVTPSRNQTAKPSAKRPGAL